MKEMCIFHYRVEDGVILPVCSHFCRAFFFSDLLILVYFIVPWPVSPGNTFYGPNYMLSTKIRLFSVLDEINVKFSKLSTSLDGQFLLKLTFSAIGMQHQSLKLFCMWSWYFHIFVAFLSIS